jgi:hypothetical protein
MASLPTAEEAIKPVTSAKNVLASSNLRLHKVVSNSVDVMETLSTEDRAKGLRDLRNIYINIIMLYIQYIYGEFLSQ